MEQGPQLQLLLQLLLPQQLHSAGALQAHLHLQTLWIAVRSTSAAAIAAAAVVQQRMQQSGSGLQRG